MFRSGVVLVALLSYCRWYRFVARRPLHPLCTAYRYFVSQRCGGSCVLVKVGASDTVRSLLVVCTGSRVPVLPVRTSGRRVPNSTRKPAVAYDIMYSAHVQIIHACLPSAQGKGPVCIVVLPWKHYPIGYPCYPWKTTRTRYPKKMLPDSALVTTVLTVPHLSPGTPCTWRAVPARCCTRSIFMALACSYWLYDAPTALRLWACDDDDDDPVNQYDALIWALNFPNIRLSHHSHTSKLYFRWLTVPY